MSREVDTILANPDLACEFMDRIGTAKIASPWWNDKRYVVGKVAGGFPVLAASVVGLIESYSCTVHEPHAHTYKPTRDEARAWCDERLGEGAWLLAGVQP